MKQILTICKKELKSFFYSPVFYIITAFFLLVSGFFFYNILAWVNMQTLRMMQYQYGMDRININELLYQPFFNNLTIILMFLLPLLTMRLFADEKKMRTDELLFTAPLTTWQLILGKYLATMIIYLLILILTATYSIFVFLNGNPELNSLLTAYLGILLIGSIFIALGIFASSLTENQVIAAAISFSTILLIWVLSWVGSSSSSLLARFLSELSFSSHFENLVKGVVEIKDLIYYLSFSFFALYLTFTVFEFRKWR